ncbi:MAG: sugar phosphate isomerase/epimerase [Candidatus Dormibacteraeota bacterium]|nr:sugar phosphate isomerase/epimerase [Candidatus Dormibacteraeota bacterium]
MAEGLRQVEVADPYVTARESATLPSMLRDAGVAVACYDLFAGFCRESADERRAQVEPVRRGLERAASFDAKYVLILPGQVPPETPKETARLWYIDGLEACIPDARHLGLTITIANLGSQAALCGTTAHVLQIVDALAPDVRLTYDVGNFLMAGEGSLAALDRVGDRVVHVHFKDWSITAPSETCIQDGGYPGLDGRCFEGVALGEGSVDLAGAAEGLHQRGYQGAVSVEYEGIGEPRIAVTAGTDYLRSLLASLT